MQYGILNIFQNLVKSTLGITHEYFEGCLFCRFLDVVHRLIAML